jgi:hypothetical protein
MPESAVGWAHAKQSANEWIKCREEIVRQSTICPSFEMARQMATLLKEPIVIHVALDACQWSAPALNLRFPDPASKARLKKLEARG